MTKPGTPIEAFQKKPPNQFTVKYSTALYGVGITEKRTPIHRPHTLILLSWEIRKLGDQDESTQRGESGGKETRVLGNKDSVLKKVHVCTNTHASDCKSAPLPQPIKRTVRPASLRAATNSSAAFATDGDLRYPLR